MEGTGEAEGTADTVGPEGHGWEGRKIQAWKMKGEQKWSKKKKKREVMDGQKWEVMEVQKWEATGYRVRAGGSTVMRGQESQAKR